MVRLGCGSEDEAKAGVEVVSSTNYGLALRAVDLKIKKKKAHAKLYPRTVDTHQSTRSVDQRGAI